MFCYIKYSDKSPKEMSSFEEILKAIYPKIRDRSKSGSIRSITSIKERHSEEKSDHKNIILMVNPDCYIQLIIDYIYEQTGLDTNIKFDLCDENGFLLGVDKLRPQESGLKILNNGHTYVVVIYEKDENNSIKSIEPLIYKTNKQESDFFAKFYKNLSSTIGRGSTQSKRGLRSAESTSSRKSKTASRTSHGKRRSSASQRSRKSIRSN